MDYVLYILELIAVWFIMSLATNLVVGYAGMFSVGHAAYFGIGAYFAFVLNIYGHVNYLLALAVAVVGTAAAALITLLPLLRLEGFYFAVATLGLNFVVVDLLHNLMPTVQYTDGLFGVRLPGWLDSSLARFALVALLATLAFAAVSSLVSSPWGRLIQAIRDDKRAVESLGRRVNVHRAVAWALSGALSGLAGGLYGLVLLYIDPFLFTFVYSIYLLVYIGFGGLGSVFGSLLGPFILVTFSQLPRFIGLESRFIGPIEQIGYALLLILMMTFRRRGLVGRYEFLE